MRLPSLLLSFVVVPPLVLAAPVASAPSPEPRPVAPSVQTVPLDGVVEAAGLSALDLGAGAHRRTVVHTAPRDTEPFSTVGVTWADDPDVGQLDVQVRTRSAGTWSDWSTLDAETSEVLSGTRDEGAPGVRAGSEPAFAGPSDGVQVRIDVLSGRAPRDLQLALVDPGSSPADALQSPTLGGSVANAAAGRPMIRSRAEWGADESIRRGAPGYSSTLEAVTIHHTASSNDYTAAQVPGLIRGFYAYHVQSRGWSDIGYNVLVDKFGTAWEGRAGGLDRPVIGAHAGGFNTDTSGVSIIGTYESVEPSAASRETVAAVSAWKLGLHGRDPQGSVTLTSRGSTRYSSGTRVTLPRMFGHRDVSATSCPGAAGVRAMPSMRERAAELSRGSGPAPAPSPAPSPTPSPTPSPPPTPREVEPFGSLDAVSLQPDVGGVRASGWAIDPDAPVHTSVAITVDGAQAAVTVADRHRPDVGAAHPQYSSYHGFDVLVPVVPGTRTVCARALNQGAGSDAELGCRTVVVEPPPAATADSPPGARLTNDSCPVGSVPSGGFGDARSSVHRAAIDCAVWWELTTGLTPTSYGPNGLLTRAQVASFLARLLTAVGAQLPASPPNAFDDDRGSPHERAIDQLASLGVVNGKSGRRYDPAGTVTRGQMASYLARVYEQRVGGSLSPGGDWYDDDDGSVHEEAIGKAARAGFTGGTSATAYSPNLFTDRGQVASFLSRVLDLLVEAGWTPPRG